MSGLRAAAVEWGGFTPLGLNLSLGYEGMVASLVNETGGVNHLSGVNRKDQGPIAPEEAVLIKQFLDVEEINPLAANKLVLNGGRKVLDIIGSGTSHQAVVYQAEADDFKFHPRERYQNRPGSRWVIPVEKFGKALPIPESENLVETVVSDFNTFVLDAVTIGAMPLVGAGNLIKSIEPAIRILTSKARGEKISLSSEFKTLYKTIADEPVMKASPVLSKALLGATALAVAFGPIASTIDLKSLGKAVHSKLELNKGISFNGPNGGPEIPKWAGPISLLVLLIAACQKALDGSPDPKVTIITSTPVPTETPRPATLTPVSSTPTPEIAITPSNGAGGTEFKPGTVADLQKLIDLNSFNSAICLDVNSSQYLDTKSKLQAQGANVDSLEKALRSNLKSGQSLKLLCQQEGWAFWAVGSDGSFLWSRNTSTGQWADHPNAVRNGYSFDKIGEARPGHKLDMVVIGGKPWAVEFKNGAPIRYFDTVTGEFVDFNWSVLAGSEKLINLNMQLVDITGDFSINASVAAKDDGGGGFKVSSGDGVKELSVTVNRSKIVPLIKQLPELLIRLKDGSSIVEFKETSIGSQTDGKDVLEVKFRPGSDEITIVINNREIKTIPAKGLMTGKKLTPGVLAGRDGKMAVKEISLKVPNGGQRRGQENVKLLEVIPATATVAATLKPQFTPVPPTAAKPTSIPGNCNVPEGVPKSPDGWKSNPDSGFETCPSNSLISKFTDSVISWEDGARANGFKGYALTFTYKDYKANKVLRTEDVSIHSLDDKLKGVKVNSFVYWREKGHSNPHLLDIWIDVSP